MIKVRYSSIDGARKSRSFASVEKARAFAVNYVGEHPEFGSHYAVSADGVGKVQVEGCSLLELFGISEEIDEAAMFEAAMREQEAAERAANLEGWRAHMGIVRAEKPYAVAWYGEWERVGGSDGYSQQASGMAAYFDSLEAAEAAAAARNAAEEEFGDHSFEVVERNPDGFGYRRMARFVPAQEIDFDSIPF